MIHMQYAKEVHPMIGSLQIQVFPMVIPNSRREVIGWDGICGDNPTGKTEIFNSIFIRVLVESPWNPSHNRNTMNHITQ